MRCPEAPRGTSKETRSAVSVLCAAVLRSSSQPMAPRAATTSARRSASAAFIKSRGYSGGDPTGMAQWRCGSPEGCPPSGNGPGSGRGEVIRRELRGPADVEGFEPQLALAVEGEFEDAGEGAVADRRDPIAQGDVPLRTIAGDPAQPEGLEGVLVHPERGLAFGGVTQNDGHPPAEARERGPGGVDLQPTQQPIDVAPGVLAAHAGQGTDVLDGHHHGQGLRAHD